MFDLRSYRSPVPAGVADSAADELARRCREPAERWSLARRAHRPSAMRYNLPRVVTA